MTNLTMPSNDKYERAILATMIERRDHFPMLCQTMRVDDFYNIDYRKIFCVMLNFYQKGRELDRNDFIVACQEDGLVEAPTLIMQMASEYSIAYRHNDYASELKNCTQKRQMVSLNQQYLVKCTDPKADAQEVARLAIQELYKIQGAGQSKNTKSSREVLDGFCEGRSFEDNIQWMMKRKSQMLPPYTGVPSRYPILDKTLGYFKKAALYYVGARTSMGKTTFMLNLIANQLMSPAKRVGVFSLEMPQEQIMAKLLCMYSDILFYKYEDVEMDQENIDRLNASASMFRKLPIYINAPSSITINQLAVQAQQMKDQHDIEILYIDYLTRIKGDGKAQSKHLEVDGVSKGLQTLARQLDIPIICLSQLNRASLNRVASRPTLSDFRESGSIEEDCDGAILLHRPEYFDKADESLRGKVEVHVAKNRIRGITRRIDFYCYSKKSERYNELLEISEEVKRANSDDWRNHMKDDSNEFL